MSNTLAHFLFLEGQTVTPEVAGSSPVGSAIIFNKLGERTFEILHPFPVRVPLIVSLTGC